MEQRVVVVSESSLHGTATLSWTISENRRASMTGEEKLPEERVSWDISACGDGSFQDLSGLAVGLLWSR
jgi:hypothetical protein